MWLWYWSRASRHSGVAVAAGHMACGSSLAASATGVAVGDGESGACGGSLTGWWGSLAAGALVTSISGAVLAGGAGAGVRPAIRSSKVPVHVVLCCFVGVTEVTGVTSSNGAACSCHPCVFRRGDGVTTCYPVTPVTCADFAGVTPVSPVARGCHPCHPYHLSKTQFAVSFPIPAGPG